MQFDKELDTRGLNCPLPILRTKKALTDLTSGQVLKIVATDPMWMDVNAPTSLTMTLGLKPGDKAWILLDVPGEPAVYVGKVIEIGAESDFAGQTRRVRVELANPSEWPVGPAAWVRFAAPEGEWAKRIAEPKRTAEATGAAK